MGFKIDLINVCLPLTGNSVVNTEDDGSAEWIVGSAAYESGVKRLLGAHDWKFGTSTHTLQRVGDASDARYADAYAKPLNTLGLIWVRIGDVPADWVIIGNRVNLSAGGATVTAKVVRQPDPEQWPPLFIQALEAFTKAGIYQGLNEDRTAAADEREIGEALLAEARSRTDREESPRPVFRSRILARRRGAVTRRAV